MHIDVNECATNNGGCEQNCQNNVGSYNCTCSTGYTLNSNGYSCTGKIMICGKNCILSVIKTLMSATLTVEDVNRTVIILLVATIVHVTIVIHSIQIIIIVMVSTDYRIVYFKNDI